MARECQKTENVDLKKLLTAETRCSEIVKELLELENNPIRMVLCGLRMLPQTHEIHMYI